MKGGRSFKVQISEELYDLAFSTEFFLAFHKMDVQAYTYDIRGGRRIDWANTPGSEPIINEFTDLVARHVLFVKG